MLLPADSYRSEILLPTGWPSGTTYVMSEIDELRHQLRRTLDRAEEWLSNEPSLDLGGAVELEGATLDREWLASARQTVRQLKIRASSSLINVAFVGGFSSGKSFLIGALQHKLQYEPVINKTGISSERYIGLLFSAPQETTACPATVVPVDSDAEFDASGRGFLRVRFTGAGEWENVANSPAPAVVAAYTTQDQEMIINRQTARHREQVVAEVEILLSSFALPAKLYDLPGHGSLQPVHDEISNRAWADADCFVFTTQATQTVGKADDELIRRLYDHHVNTGKPIIWVVTGIDRANVARNLSDNKVAWQETVDKDNDYLHGSFPSPYGKPNTFYGTDGFIGVSPAWEAYGEWLATRENRQEADGDNYVGASGMGRLRNMLTSLIENGTGHKHISIISREAASLISSRFGLLVELLETARIPLDRLAAENNDLRRRLNQLQDTIPNVRQQLATALQSHARNVERAFRGLPEYLHSELDDQIRTADLTKEREANRIDSRKIQMLKEWAADHGPEHIWSEESQKFMDTALSAVRVALGDTRPVDKIGATGTRVDLDQLTIRPSERYRTGAQDIIGQVSKLLGIGTPIVTGIAAAAGLISGPILAVPVGFTLAAGLIYGLIRRNRGKSDALDLLRSAWIQSLDEAAKDYRVIFALAITARASEVIDRAAEILAERAAELSRKIILAESGLAAPDNASRKELVARLEPYCKAGEKLISELNTLVGSAR
jgi:hypothetical protein